MRQTEAQERAVDVCSTFEVVARPCFHGCFCSVCSVCCCMLLFARPQPSRSGVVGKLAAEGAGWSFVAFLFFFVSFSGSLMRSLSCFFSFLVESVTCVFFLLCLPSFFLSLPPLRARMHGWACVLLVCVRACVIDRMFASRTVE